MNVSNSIKNLFKDDFCFFFIRLVIFTCDILLEVVVVIIEDNLEQLFLWFIEDVDKWYNVRVLFKCFEKGYLSQGTWRYSFFFSLEFDVFDSHKFIVFVYTFEYFSKSTFSNDTQLCKSISFFHFLKIL